MDLCVTYVHHNCFCLDLDEKTLVFDYPDHEHRPEAAEAVVRDALRGRDAYIFFSHSHADHCSADILEPAKAARSVRFVLSYDVPDMVPELDLPRAAVVEPGDDPAGGCPGEPVTAGDLTVSGLESNDLGVAFFIRAGGLKLYFGGDLAEWTWPGTDETAQAHTRAFFGRSLDAVAAFGPEMAFMDCDLRLPNLGGFERFARTVRPQALVPTHDFGNPTGVAAAASAIRVEGTRMLTYSACGERIELSL